MRKKKGSIYHWVDSLGSIVYTTDTGHPKDQIRFDLGHYLTREEAEEKQRNIFRSVYPTFSEKRIDTKIAEIKKLTMSR
ncbi:hypothetical protein E2605_07790 [Dysgonomonas capnocytophagoides]|uniref:Uncharacterized protein n=1 Tax=Dysgonomonas capnocytophagoides TaxID=45254 RepID=A0A4Y8L2D4_9BACT|nr:hypothetical protein [Dysgonomonas capnocytophagoides]TFD96713.1 hypothetical protein E2605_07790 [Dysgonomonas capnocytophagoides]